MESTTDKVVKKVVNLFIAAGWMYLFHSLGWITFTVEMPLLQVVALTALVAWLVEWIFDFLYLTFLMATCGIGCVTMPIVMAVQGWIFLWGAAKITHWFTINEPLWGLGLLMSIAIGYVRIPSAATSTTSTTSTT
jgi:hypothetical protein